MTRIAERLGGMTLRELAARMDADELRLWETEDLLRAEEERDQMLIARAKVAARG